MIYLSYSRYVERKNGDSFTNVHYYFCDICQDEMCESEFIYTNADGTHLCLSCAFKLDKINEKCFLGCVGIHVNSFHAAINPNGEIEVWSGNKTPKWQRTNKQQRHSGEYTKWRNDVYERDNFTCMDCNVRGGKLNAHHIKSYSKYKELRFAVSNGITLCIECHKKRHKRR